MLGAFDGWMITSLGGLDSAVNGSTGGWRHVIARVTPAAVSVRVINLFSHIFLFSICTLNNHFLNHCEHAGS